MDRPVEVFRSSRYKQAERLVACVFLTLVAGLYIVNIRQISGLVFFLFLAGLFVVLFVNSLYALTLSQEGVSVWNWFRQNSIAWNQIRFLQPRPFGSFFLGSSSSSTKVFVSYWNRGYSSVVQRLLRKHPDIWFPLVRWRFQNSNLYKLISLLMTLGWGAYCIYSLSQGNQMWAFLSWLLSSGTLAGLIFGLQGVGIEGPVLVFAYRFKQQSIKASEVRSLRLITREKRNTFFHAIILELEDGGERRLSGMNAGPLAMIASLYSWLEHYNPGVPVLTERDP